MTENLPNPNEAWRNFTKRAAIDACKLCADDLKRLYRIINEKQIEHCNRITTGFFKTDNETPEQFHDRVKKTKDAFITTVSITGLNGDVVIGHGEAIFDSALVPERIASILYDTSFSPQAQLKYTPTDRITVLLDFSQPPLMDITNPPSAPTLNNSNFFISAETESWSRSLSSQLNDFFAERATRVNWLHKAAAYDALLLLLGLPISLWGTYRVSRIITINSNLPDALITAIYVYIFIFLLSIFRGLFSYSRWIFPKIEPNKLNSIKKQQRGIWYFFVGSVLVAAIWDGIKLLIG